ncbi:MAG: hypothetical protein R3B09_12970 [Nannocystaceae bacterium]
MPAAPRLAPLLGLVGLLTGCHGAGAEGPSTTTGTTGEESSSGASGASGPILTTTTFGSSTTTGGGASATGGEASGSTSGDAGTSGGSDETSDTSASTGEPGTCKKLDLLFVIIDHGALWDTTYALKKLMPHVAQRLESDFDGWDYHVMVANPDGKWGSAYCEEACATEPCVWDNVYPCGYTPSACDLTRGAGVTFPAGADASNMPCPIDGEQRYVVSGQQDLAGTLACLGRVGTGHDNSKLYPVARGTLDALSGSLGEPGACNEGFLRDDAYLILFVIAPFPDILSEGTPEQWAEELKAHKDGKFDKIYFIGLFNGCDSGVEWWEYEPLNEWTRALYHHQNDDACASTLLPYMDPALDYVLGDCQG